MSNLFVRNIPSIKERDFKYNGWKIAVNATRQFKHR